MMFGGDSGSLWVFFFATKVLVHPLEYLGTLVKNVKQLFWGVTEKNEAFDFSHVSLSKAEVTLDEVNKSLGFA